MLGDLDGDGVTEIAVGAPGDDQISENAGAVWILFLRPDATVRSYQKITSAGYLPFSEEYGGFGASLAALGDLDGDGVEDLAVGLPNDAEHRDGPSYKVGAVWILFLNADGSVKSAQKISDVQGGFSGGLRNYDRFGTGLAPLGDFDGDGVPDLAVGAEHDADAVFAVGAVWLLFLNSDGTVKSHRKISATQGGFRGDIVGDRSDRDAHFGWSLTLLGDVNGDGTPDIGVGHGSIHSRSGEHGSSVWVLFLNPDGTVFSHQRLDRDYGGETGEGSFSGAVAGIGDLDGDGLEDLAIGLRILFLGSGPLTTEPVREFPDQRRCITSLNRGMRKVVNAQAKEARLCLRQAVRGELAGAIEDCFGADPKRRVAKATAKLAAHGASKCSVPPDFGASDAGTVAAAALRAPLELIHDAFGSNLEITILSEETDSAASHCQLTLTRLLERCEDARLKTFTRCVRRGLKDGSIESVWMLETCLDADDRSDIAGPCALDGGRPAAKIESECSGVSLSVVAPVCGTDSLEELATCLDSAGRCRICLAIASANAFQVDCDLHDNGVSDGSCL